MAYYYQEKNLIFKFLNNFIEKKEHCFLAFQENQKMLEIVNEKFENNAIAGVEIFCPKRDKYFRKIMSVVETTMLFAIKTSESVSDHVKTFEWNG